MGGGGCGYKVQMSKYEVPGGRCFWSPLDSARGPGPSNDNVASAPLGRTLAMAERWFDCAHQPWFDCAHQPWFVGITNLRRLAGVLEDWFASEA